MCDVCCKPKLDDDMSLSADTSPLPSPHSISEDIVFEKHVTILEYMNHKIVDPDDAIADLKSKLEKSISNYNI